MRFRRKSVDIVVSGDRERARPDSEPAPDAGPEASPAPARVADDAPALGASPPALPPLEPLAAPGAGSNGNGSSANGSGGNGSNGAAAGGNGSAAPVGVPFGAAVVSFEPPTSSATPTPVPPAGGAVATLAPPASIASPVAYVAPAPVAPAPVAPAPVAPAPVAYVAPAPVAPAPVVPAPVVPTPVAPAPVAYVAPEPVAHLAPAPVAPTQAAPASIAVVPIEWTAPGWREYRQRLAAAAAARAAAPPVSSTPLPHVLSAPLVAPAAAPAPDRVTSPPSDAPAGAGPDPAARDAAATASAAPEPTAPPKPGAPSHLGEMLLARDLVTREQLDQALAEQSATGMRIGSQLVSMGFVTERELVSVLAEQLEMRVADLRLVAPEPEAVALVPEEIARRLEVVPVRMTPEGLEVARSDALSDAERAEIESAVDGKIIPVLATPSEIQRAIDSTYQALAGMAQQVQAYADLAKTRAPVETGTQIVVDDRAPVVQVVTLLLTQAVRDRTSDIHIEPQDGDVRVRFRIDGVLRDVTTIPAAMAQALISRIKVMADMNIVERRRSQDGQITTEIDGRPLDVRVATTATIWGEKAVLRLLDKTRSLRALSDLGMTRDTARQFSELVVSPFGMVICAGPTGSGKTTTLYAALNEINVPERNITTIEDPVEYVLPRINQIQVNRQAGITFADGLKSIMRQDPDVILVGEIRDVETARIAVQSALTGHFVLSSLHATDCATALQRFRDMGIEPFLINSSVLALEAQRLVRRICVHCREPYEPTAAERAFFVQATGYEKETWTHGAGCNLCSHTGYSERIGVYELMRITDEIQDLVLKDAGHDEIQAVAVEGGMRTLKDEAVRLVAEDTTTVAEAFRSVYTR